MKTSPEAKLRRALLSHLRKYSREEQHRMLDRAIRRLERGLKRK